MAELQIGDVAPHFTNPTESQDFTLSEHKGKNIVLFFYPKDDTPGCTLENIDFTALLPEFEAHNTILVGCSADPVAKHAKFREKHDLKIILLSDEDHETMEAYGAWGEKKMYGKTFMGIKRTTFLIDENGKIAHIWRNVRAKGHAQKVLDKLIELENGA